MKDRVVQYPSRYKLTLVGGTTDTYDLVPVTGTITEAGTPISKATMLDDTVASKLFNGTISNPTVNDALNKYAEEPIAYVDNFDLHKYLSGEMFQNPYNDYMLCKMATFNKEMQLGRNITVPNTGATFAVCDGFINYPFG